MKRKKKKKKQKKTKTNNNKKNALNALKDIKASNWFYQSCVLARRMGCLSIGGAVLYAANVHGPSHRIVQHGMMCLQNTA